MYEAPAGASSGEKVKSLEDVGAPLVTDNQSAEAAEPSQGALDHPAMASEALTALDTASGDAVADSALAQAASATWQIIGFIGVELGRAPAWPAPTLAHRRHGGDRFFEAAAVVDIGRGDPKGERQALGISDEVALGPSADAVGRVGAGLLARFFARTDALSP